MSHKIKIYLDTSVFGGFFEKEFEEYTKPLFERITNGEFTLVLSDLTQNELKTAPVHVRDLMMSVKTDTLYWKSDHPENLHYENERKII